MPCREEVLGPKSSEGTRCGIRWVSASLLCPRGALPGFSLHVDFFFSLSLPSSHSCAFEPSDFISS